MFSEMKCTNPSAIRNSAPPVCVLDAVFLAIERDDLTGEFQHYRRSHGHQRRGQKSSDLESPSMKYQSKFQLPNWRKSNATFPRLRLFKPPALPIARTLVNPIMFVRQVGGEVPLESSIEAEIP